MTTTNEIWRWTGTQMASGIRTGLISAREATESCLARIDAVNPTLNALAEVTPDEALEMADAADAVVRQGEPLGPLHGVPVSIKINSDQKGHVTTHGVAQFTDIAEADGPHVANIRKAGAVFVGRSNVPAFSYRWFTSCVLHGQTLNPWSAKHTPGGSTGGGASAVASGMVPIAQGNDIGGSIRYPAYACGLTGIRPTPGRVPSQYGPPGAHQPLSVQTMLVQGPLARSVSDLRLALEAMCQPNLRDPLYVPVPLALPRPERQLRVGLLRDAGIATPEPVVNDALDRAAACLEAAGLAVEQVELPFLADAWRLWWMLALEDFRLALPDILEAGDHYIIEVQRHYFATAARWWGEMPSTADILGGWAERDTLAWKFLEFFKDFDLLIMPNSARQAIEQEADLEGTDVVGGLISAQWPQMAVPMFGCPAISVPTGVVNGLPTGVQIVANRFREGLLFDVVDIIEAHLGAITPIDPR